MAETQSRKYNGKEFVEAHGYDTYDYGARGYYPPIMRFTTVDPLAEKYYSVSPYAYCGNNPVRFVDPDGKGVFESIKNYFGNISKSLSFSFSVGLQAGASAKVGSFGVDAKVNMLSVKLIEVSNGKMTNMFQEANKFEQEATFAIENIGLSTKTEIQGNIDGSASKTQTGKILTPFAEFVHTTESSERRDNNGDYQQDADKSKNNSVQLPAFSLFLN
jgi:RHS repeat-associated protein